MDLSNLNWFDTTVISIVFISTVFALFRGFIKAIFSLITWASSGLIAAWGYSHSYAFFSTRIHSEKLAMAVAFLGVFLIAFIIIAIINSRIVHMLRKQTGGLADRTLGFSFGALRGALIVCLIFFSISLTSRMLHLGNNQDRPGPDWFANAKTYEVLDMATSGMLSFAPADMPAMLEQTVNKFKDITLSAMGDELEASPGAVKTLTDPQRLLMKQIISTLPPEDLGDIYKKYDGNTTVLSEFEKVEIFREILSMYQSYVKEGKVPVDKIVPESQVKELDGALNAGKPLSGANTNSDVSTDSANSNELGYKSRNIKQLDRLIGDM